jgi:hypothetical protein
LRQIAFGRGRLGFVLINAEPGSNPLTCGPEGNGWLQTRLPAGSSCDVIHSNLTTDKMRCLTENGQEVPPGSVHPDGKANIPVHPMDAVALHVGARLLGE